MNISTRMTIIEIDSNIWSNYNRTDMKIRLLEIIEEKFPLSQRKYNEIMNEIDDKFVKCKNKKSRRTLLREILSAQTYIFL
jgi:hypothetical protein